MLHDPDRHEPIVERIWAPDVARATIASIVREAREGFTLGSQWPWHPKDLDLGDDATRAPLPMYHGAAGVLWGIHHLAALGACEIDSRTGDSLEELLQLTRLRSADASASYMMGETPVLMMMLDSGRDAATKVRLAELIEHNIDHVSRELMWGAPGTMLAAHFLYERTGEDHWAELFRRSAQHLRSCVEWSDELACHYWRQELYGRTSNYLGAVHGFAGTALALIRGRALMGATQWSEWQDIIMTTSTRTAIRESNGANWPIELSGRPRSKRLMQVCHGSPGFAICLAQFPSDALDELLIAAGEETWTAGPLAKGSSLCHGTCGNGYAFLKLYERTGHTLWLERARAFAMHAIAQIEADRREFNQTRLSLWTGDLGCAMYLWDCIRAQAAFPMLDVFFSATQQG
jgi:hypothetical protein